MDPFCLFVCLTLTFASICFNDFFQEAGISMASRTKRVNRLCLAWHLLSTCSFLLVREILCDSGESQWDLLGVWPSVCSEEISPFFPGKGLLAARETWAVCFPSGNLFERINENIPQRQRSTNTDEVFHKDHNLENTINKPDTSFGRCRLGL